MVGPFAAFESFLFRALDITGRSTRAEFWWAFLAQFLVYMVTIPMDIWSLYVHGFDYVGFSGMLTPWIALLLLVPNLTLAMRRFHDTGASSFRMACVIIPFIGTPLFFYFLAKPSDPERNKWGDPRHGAKRPAPSEAGFASEAMGQTGQAGGGKHNAFASYAYLINGEAEPTPEMKEQRRAEVADYYRTHVLGEPAGA